MIVPANVQPVFPHHAGAAALSTGPGFGLTDGSVMAATAPGFSVSQSVASMQRAKTSIAEAEMRRWVLDPWSGESIAQVRVTKSTMHRKANARLVESALGKLRAPHLLVVASLEALRATDVWRRLLRTDFAD